jgi:indolepyruvate ferredoxin oxidoreductase
MLADYLVRVEELLPQIDAARLRLACDILAMPMSVRGYGHVQLASLAMSRMREAELLFRFDSGRYARPTAGAQAGQFKGISIISS